MKCILGQILKEKGWTQTKLAEVSKVPQGTISIYSRSKVDNYNISYLFAIKKALNLNSIDELFEEE